MMDLRIVIISDTHELHDEVRLPDGDVLICSGDVSRNGKVQAIAGFVSWFAAQSHPFKILIAGNHDFLFERDRVRASHVLPADIIYLEDSGRELDLDGHTNSPWPSGPNGSSGKNRSSVLKLWGSPVTPWFFDWAFNRQRGLEIRRHWDLIPSDVDILVTHGPPYGILDENSSGEHTGCEELLAAVNRIKPKLHVFGHIHEGYGREQRGGITFVNGCQVDERYRLVNEPQVVTLSL